MYRTSTITAAIAGVVVALAGHPMRGQSAALASVLPSSITIPFDVYHDFILVQAEVDGHKGMFVLDTGSPVIALNGEYLQRSATGTIDTVTTRTERSGHVPVTAHTVAIGTMRYAIDSADKGPPVPFPANTYIAYDKRFKASGDRPILGFLGLPALERFEVIVDYSHKQLTLIPLDSAGKRSADVKRFAVRATVPLVPMDIHWWGVQGTLGDSLTRILLVDTGCPFNMLHADTRTALGPHLTDAGLTPIPNTQPDGTPYMKDQQSWRVDRVALGSTAIVANASRFIHSEKGQDEILGNAFLQQLTVVGFNFRTHTLITYR